MSKYLEPFNEGTEYGPQISTWTKSKLDLEIWVNGNLLCLSIGQTVQEEEVLLQHEIKDTQFCNKCILCEDGWPSL